MATKAVKVSARNRAFRVLIQGLAFDVAAALVIYGYTVLTAATAWGDLEWAIISFSLTKTVGVSCLSYLMRTVFANAMPPVEDK